jgi:SAM-dependent methyltransferase
VEYPTDKYEYVNCDLCGKDNADLVLIGKDLYNRIPGEFRVVRCRNCGFVYTNPRPYGEELSKYYPDDAGYFIPILPKERSEGLDELRKWIVNKLLAGYLGYSHLSNINSVEKVLLFPLYLLIKRNLEIRGIPHFHQNGRLLEVGCSYGSYLKKMKELGWEAAGVEPNRKAAEFGSKEFGVRIINDTFENAIINEQFDVIAMRMVLEHLPTPSKAIKKAYELLKKDGELIIIVPDFSGIEFRLFKQYCYALHVPNHLNFPTPLTIRRFCQKYGFKVERIIHHKFDRDFVASAQYMKESNRWLAPVLSNKFFRKTFLKVVVSLLSYLGMTSRMTVWARKRGSKK